jgi:hypothetical protein
MVLGEAMAGFAARNIEKAEVCARPDICVRSYRLPRLFECRKDDGFIVNVTAFQSVNTSRLVSKIIQDLVDNLRLRHCMAP